MVAIAPFRALRYDPQRVDLARVTSLPHDCVTAAERDAHVEHPHSILRIALGPSRQGDVPGVEDPASRAVAWLADWQKQGILVRDATPAFYLYEITWGEPGARRRMRGLIARLRLDATYEEVRPHEHVLSGKKSGRLRLRAATQCDVEPIWLLYRDRRAWVEELMTSNAFDEVQRFTTPDGHEHALWRIDRSEAVVELTAQFDDRTLVIADGHHRYQTALEHHAATGRPQDGSILVCLVRDDDPGLALVATHRLVRLEMDVATALQRAQRAWHVARLPTPTVADGPALAGALNPDGRDVAVVHRGAAGLEAHLLTLRAGFQVEHGRGRLDRLAVTRVQERLLAEAWQIDVQQPEQHLHFTRDAVAALEEVEAGREDVAVLLPPEPVDAVLDVAKEGQKMPQKATYFIPKLQSGVVLGPLDEPLPRPWLELAGDGGKPDMRLPRLG